MDSQFDQVFVITYGRSGSTLLQRVLNSIDGYLIRGENNEALLYLFRSVKAITDGQRKIASQLADGSKTPSSSSSHPWFGIHEIDSRRYSTALVRTFVEHVIAPDEGVRVYGFKEIRYASLPRQLPSFLEFIRTSFSNPAFVFNYRNLDDVVRSRWWSSQEPEELKAKLHAFESVASQFAVAHRDRCIELRYEDYSADSAAWEPLFNFLGEQFNAEDVERILRQRLTH